MRELIAQLAETSNPGVVAGMTRAAASARAWCRRFGVRPIRHTWRSALVGAA